MKNQILNDYENYWGSKKKNEEFFGYERNWYLPQLLKSNEVVLDLGCGDGAVGEFLIQKFNNEVYGLDFSSQALNVAKKRGLKVTHGSSEEAFPFPDNKFDMVFWGDNIEHIFHPEKTIKEIFRVLKPGGRVIISCPNMGYWRYRVEYLLTGEISTTEWITKYPWESQHIRFFSKRLLNLFLKLNGFSEKRFIGISRRRLDLPLLKLFPQYFGMIMMVEAIKNDK
jgi:methionine biosynthesis protein MetW